MMNPKLEVLNLIDTKRNEKYKKKKKEKIDEEKCKRGLIDVIHYRSKTMIIFFHRDTKCVTNQTSTPNNETVLRNE